MKSAVAGILDAEGRLRVVVTDGCFYCHIANMKERLFIVPGLLVQEPVPVEDWPKLVSIVQDYINELQV